MGACVVPISNIECAPPPTPPPSIQQIYSYFSGVFCVLTISPCRLQDSLCLKLLSFCLTLEQKHLVVS